MTMRCSACREENPAGVKYCIHCGEPLPPEEKKEAGERFKTFVAVLIAIVSLVGAILAWRISVADSLAADSDVSGTVSIINRNQALAASEADMYRNLWTYLQVRIHDLVSDDLVREAQQYPGADPTRDRLWDESWTEIFVAEAYLEQVNIRPEYIRPDGSYDGQAAQDIDLAHRALAADLDPQGRYFRQADQLRLKAQWLIALASVLSIALVSYTLAEVITHASKYVFLALGSAVFVLAVLGLILVELAVI